MFIHTDTSTSIEELFELRPSNYTLVLHPSSVDEIVDVEPPSQAENDLSDPGDKESQMELEGGIELTESSRQALQQLQQEDLVTYERFEDFERYVRNR